MYTITRKLSMVCLAVVFSVLMYGCGGGSSDQAEMTPDGTDGTDGMAMTHLVNTDMVTDGLTIMPGTHSIQPGESEDAGDATFTCLAGGLSCDVTVTVADDGSTTVESVGGMATAMDSVVGTLRVAVMTAEGERDAALEDLRIAEETAEMDRVAAAEELRIAEAALRLANLRLNASDVDLDELDANFMTIPEGVYTIQQDQNMDVGDANFACPADATDPCEVTVDEDGNVTSAGGVATAQNSVAAMNTMTAIALSAADALGMQEAAGPTGAPAIVGVSRSPSGETTIELTHVADATDEVEYDPGKAVDTGHEIAGWMGQTLKRDNSEAADAEADTDAVPANEMDEATFYTNIDPAKAGKLKEVPATGVDEITVDASLMLDGLIDEEDTFMATIVLTDGTEIPGTFTCDADPCAAVTVEEELILGATVLADNPGTGWEFESDDNVKLGETPDANYMYFGYWLKSPVGDGTTDYAFATFADGNADFLSDNRTLYDSDDLTATYEGGAAGMYVSRELRLVGGLVDPYSPGTYGRFTAKAELEANFGTHAALDVDGTSVTVTNTIHGTISEFRDGDTDLGFAVTLNRREITQGTGLVESGTTTAMFGDSGPGTGAWNAKLFGPDVDMDSSDREKNAFPTGIAGRFDAETTNATTTASRVVGAFAAEEK